MKTADYNFFEITTRTLNTQNVRSCASDFAHWSSTSDNHNDIYASEVRLAKKNRSTRKTNNLHSHSEYQTYLAHVDSDKHPQINLIINNFKKKFIQVVQVIGSRSWLSSHISAPSYPLSPTDFSCQVLQPSNFFSIPLSRSRSISKASYI